MTPQRPLVVLCAALFVSLAANFFMGGLLLAQGHNRHAAWEKKDAELKLKLPKADKAVLQDAMRANRDAFRALRENLDAARRGVRAAVQSGDGDALEAALTREQAAKKELLQKMQESRDAVLGKLSAEGRAALAEFGVQAKKRYDWKQRKAAQHDGGGLENDPDLIWYASQQE